MVFAANRHVAVERQLRAFSNRQIAGNFHLTQRTADGIETVQQPLGWISLKEELHRSPEETAVGMGSDLTRVSSEPVRLDLDIIIGPQNNIAAGFPGGAISGECDALIRLEEMTERQLRDKGFEDRRGPVG